MRGSLASRRWSTSLQGEKIDIIPWNDDAATFIVNALQPAEVTKVVMDEDAQRIEVVVPDEQLSQAIGRRGQNVRLASQLTGWDIDIMTEAEESERRQAEFKERTNMFQETMNVDEMVAQLLVSEGFTSLEEVAFVELDELLVIDGFDETTAEELQARAQESLEEVNQRTLAEARELGAQDDLINIEGLTPGMVLALAKDDVRVGKVIEGKLNTLGIYHFDQIAKWNRKEINWVTTFLNFKGRIDRENWIEQAKLLAAGEETEFSKRVDKGSVGSSKD